MITTVSIARFVWSPFLWLALVLLSSVIIMFLCHAFDSMAENEAASDDKGSAEENEMITDEVAVFTRNYIKIWSGNRYKYVLLPFVLLVIFLIVLFVG